MTEDGAGQVFFECLRVLFEQFLYFEYLVGIIILIDDVFSFHFVEIEAG